MNKKAILIASLILGLVVLVPLVAAAPSLVQNQNGDTLQTQDQDRLQTRDCNFTCLQDGTCVNDCPQNGTCTQNQRCLQTRDCNITCTETGVCNGDGICDQTQTRQRQQGCTQTGITGSTGQNRYGHQNRCGQ